MHAHRTVLHLSRNHRALNLVCLYYYVRFLQGDTFLQIGKEASIAPAHAADLLQRWRIGSARRWASNLPSFESAMNDRINRDQILAILGQRWEQHVLPEIERSAAPDLAQRLIEEIRISLQLHAATAAIAYLPPEKMDPFETMSALSRGWLRQYHVVNNESLLRFLQVHHGLPFDLHFTKPIVMGIRKHVAHATLHPEVDLSHGRTTALAHAALRARERERRNILPADTVVDTQPLSQEERYRYLQQINSVRDGTHPAFEGVEAISANLLTVIKALANGAGFSSALRGNGYFDGMFNERDRRDEGHRALKQVKDIASTVMDPDVVVSLARDLVYHDTVRDLDTRDSLSLWVSQYQPRFTLTAHALHAIDLAHERRYGEPMTGIPESDVLQRLTSGELRGGLLRLAYLGNEARERTLEVLFRWALALDEQWL